MPGLCELVRASLPSLVDEAPAPGGVGAGEEVARPDGPLAAHVETCLRCQAELAQYRRLRRSLRRLRAAEAAAPAGLVRDVLGHVEAAVERAAARRRRAAYALAATAAGAGAAVGITSRLGHRRASL